MGFYYGSKRSGRNDSPVITPREYTSLLATSLSAVAPGALQASDTYRRRAADATTTSTLIKRLSEQARRHPGDPRTHRRLGIAQLYAGNCKPAVCHLEIAFKIRFVQATTAGSVQQTLCARLDLALLLPVLIPLCRLLGKRETIRRLLSDVLLAR